MTLMRQLPVEVEDDDGDEDEAAEGDDQVEQALC